MASPSAIVRRKAAHRRQPEGRFGCTEYHQKRLPDHGCSCDAISDLKGIGHFDGVAIAREAEGNLGGARDCPAVPSKLHQMMISAIQSTTDFVGHGGALGRLLYCVLCFLRVSHWKCFIREKARRFPGQDSARCGVLHFYCLECASSMMAIDMLRFFGE
jgi:hypothetical protein